MILIFEFFEYIRRSNADLYTANPLENLDDKSKAALAAELNMTPEQFQEYMRTPHDRMTCPLCGRPSTHLVGCKGCGGDAWGGEAEMVWGDDFRDSLRIRLQQAVKPIKDVKPAQIEHAAEHAWTYGGCMVCPECWHNTLPAEAYATCPLKLLADRTLEPSHLPFGLMFAMQNKAGEDERAEAAREWLKAAWIHWTDAWNTVADPEQRKRVWRWRHHLLAAAWDVSPEGDAP